MATKAIHPRFAPALIHAPGQGGRGIGLRRLRTLVPAFLLVAVALLLSTRPAEAQILLKEPPAETRGVDVLERLGNQIPPDIQLVDSSGTTVPITKYFQDDGKPVVLVMAYYDCPIVCTVVLNKLQEVFNRLDYTIGRDYKVVTVSFDHTNTTPMAAERKAGYLAGYDRFADPELRPQIEAGWEFHTASAANASRLADSVGFRYRYLPDSGEYSHPIAFMVLTPQGKVARYIYGFDYPPTRVRLALLEASEGQIAESIADRLLLFCFHYDPTRGAYTMQAMRFMRIGGVLSMLCVGGLITSLRIAERRRTHAGRRATHASQSPPAPAFGAAAGVRP